MNFGTPYVSLLKIERTAKNDSCDDMQPEPFDAVYNTQRRSTSKKHDFDSQESL